MTPAGSFDLLRDWHESYETLKSTSHLIIRTHESREAIDETCERLRLRNSTAVSLLDQHPGRPPKLDQVDTGEPSELLTRARAIELATLLEWGGGIWNPDDYHFQLPSGEHVSTFVKVANAIRVPRDGHVLATWFDAVVSNDVGIIADSRTLTGLVTAIELRLAAHSLSVADIVVLDRYPSTQLDVSEAVARLAANSSSILAILSVSSSGRILDKLTTALERGHPEVPTPESSIQILVRATSPEERAPGAWVPGPQAQISIQTGGNAAQVCDMCQDARRSHVVPIDPERFEGVMPAEIERMMPSWVVQSKNSEFWESAANAGAIELEADADPWIAGTRAKAPLPVKLSFDKLLADGTFAERVAGQLRIKVPLIKDWAPPELVLVPEGETSLAGYDRLWRRIQTELGNPPRLSFPPGPWPEALTDQVQKPSRFLVLSLGAITGSSLETGLLGIQRARSTAGYVVTGLAIHSRPTSPRLWDDLRNVFDDRLGFCWQTFLPLDWSPLREELRLLLPLAAQAAEACSDEANQFLNRRLLVCRGTLTPAVEPLFWGGQVDSTLSPHALPGNELDAVGTFAAVGTAIHSKRSERPTDRRPVRRMFDMARALGSYFDDLIIASILRWVRPAEAFWGRTDDSSEFVLHQLLNRAPHMNHRLIVSELLLALAGGKIPTQRMELLKSHALALRDRATGELPPSVELALAAASLQLRGGAA